MVVGLALCSIAGAVVTAIGLFPVIGPWSILAAPFGGSCAAVAAGMIGAATRDRAAAAGADVDGMVDSLRSVLDDTRRAESEGPSAPAPAAEDHSTRAAG